MADNSEKTYASLEELYAEIESQRTEFDVQASGPSAGSDVVSPAGDYPGKQYPQPGADGLWPKDVWTGYPLVPGRTDKGFRQPIYVAVWCDPQFKTVYDASGVSLYKRWRQYCYCVGRCCGLAFVEVDHAYATYRYYYRHSHEVEAISIQYANFAGGVGSSYYAVNPNGRATYHNGTIKRTAGGGGNPVGWPTAIRIFGRANWFRYGFRSHDDRHYAIGAMGNPNLSAGFSFQWPETGDLAGHSAVERAHLRNTLKLGPPWLWRHGSKGLEAYP